MRVEWARKETPDTLNR